jgi:membrane-associated phospholipid phosphatase
VSLWSLVAGTYGLILTIAVLTMPIARRHVAATACAGYALVAIGLGTLVSSFWVQLVVPGALLLTGYWLSGFFFRDPQPWLEQFLVTSDKRVFRALAVDDWLERAPALLLEAVEASYAADYVVVALGAIIAASAGTERIAAYWSLVLASELACYGALPWLRSRPPRALEPPGVMAQRAPLLRRLNTSILDRASVQANTLPSGHVAGAVAAALGVWPVDPAAGLVLLVVALAIAIAAVVGRYHYVVDCVAGASVALLVWSLM